MENKKIAIIGAGIVGLYLAWKLSEIGHQVTVFEKKERIGKENCSGLISQRILEFIPPLSAETHTLQKSNTLQKGMEFIPQSKDLIENKIEYCLIHFPKKTIKIKFSKKFLVINRFQLDNLVTKLAQGAGTKIILGNSISRFDLDKFQEGFDKIIGCDGANSLVRKSLNLPDPQFRLSIQGFLARSDFSNWVEVFPTKSGFFWKIPRGKEIEYGMIGRPEKIRKIFEEFQKKLKISLRKINSGLSPQGLILPSNPKVTLCGDAAGLTKPWSGGGVVWGLTAADILLKNFPDFLKYKEELKKFFLPKIILSKIATKAVYFFGFKMPWLLPKNYKIESDFLI